jgi:hypothetical protein
MLYVTYAVAPQQKGPLRRANESKVAIHSSTAWMSSPPAPTVNQPLPKNVQEFLHTKPESEIIASYVDILESRRTAKWPQLQKALDLCKQQQATLLILELGTLASHESFTQTLLVSPVAFQCLDQPFVDKTILEALRKHAEVQRKLHGKLIREGLKLTSAKSGNPHAAEVIGKVNKPKIDTAIVFALLLQPIIQDYRRSGYSQRHMVKTLNDEGFTAPEGGKWVLSQLQKVLDRVRLNEVAIAVKPTLESLPQTLFNLKEIAEALNSRHVSPIKSPLWDESQVKKLQDRIQQIKDINFINRFVLALLPILQVFRERQLSPLEMIAELHQAGIPIKRGELLGDHHHVEPRLKLLKEVLRTHSEETNHLEYAFESAAKHMPVYLKIVKGHIEQLAKVLELETHHQRNLNNAGLAEPVVQLIQLFRELSNNDIELLEVLASETRHFTVVESLAQLIPDNEINVL